MNAAAQFRKAKCLDMVEGYNAWKREREARNECWSQIGRQWLHGGDIVAIDYDAANHDAVATGMRDEILEELSRLTGLTFEQLHEVLA